MWKFLFRGNKCLFRTPHANVDSMRGFLPPPAKSRADPERLTHPLSELPLGHWGAYRDVRTASTPYVWYAEMCDVNLTQLSCLTQNAQSVLHFVPLSYQRKPLLNAYVLSSSKSSWVDHPIFPWHPYQDSRRSSLQPRETVFLHRLHIFYIDIKGCRMPQPSVPM